MPPPPRRLRNACNACGKRRRSCKGGSPNPYRPCERCEMMSKLCEYGYSGQGGRFVNGKRAPSKAEKEAQAQNAQIQDETAEGGDEDKEGMDGVEQRLSPDSSSTLRGETKAGPASYSVDEWTHSGSIIFDISSVESPMLDPVELNHYQDPTFSGCFPGRHPIHRQAPQLQMQPQIPSFSRAIDMTQQIQPHTRLPPSCPSGSLMIPISNDVAETYHPRLAQPVSMFRPILPSVPWAEQVLLTTPEILNNDQFQGLHGFDQAMGPQTMDEIDQFALGHTSAFPVVHHNQHGSISPATNEGNQCLQTSRNAKGKMDEMWHLSG